MLKSYQWGWVDGASLCGGVDLPQNFRVILSPPGTNWELNLLGIGLGLKVLGQGMTIIRRGRIIKAVYFDYFVLSFNKIYLLDWLALDCAG